jgi:N-acetylmuramidase
MFFKDDPQVVAAALPPTTPIVISGSPVQRSIAGTYDRIGGLLSILAKKAGVPIEGALAVWQVESGGAPPNTGKPILRFENHKFFQNWGKSHAAVFDQHFQFGGHAGIPGDPWKNHRWRANAGAPWETFHGNQDHEYEVFGFASTLGGAEAACLSSSFGGPQILGSNHEIVGYGSAKALFDAMVQSERWEVCSFFDFCGSNHILDEVKQQKWEGFARVYNGSGQAAAYGGKIKVCFDAAMQLNIP